MLFFSPRSWNSSGNSSVMSTKDSCFHRQQFVTRNSTWQLGEFLMQSATSTSVYVVCLGTEGHLPWCSSWKYVACWVTACKEEKKITNCLRQRVISQTHALLSKRKHANAAWVFLPSFFFFFVASVKQSSSSMCAAAFWLAETQAESSCRDFYRTDIIWEGEKDVLFPPGCC